MRYFHPLLLFSIKEMNLSFKRLINLTLVLILKHYGKNVYTSVLLWENMFMNIKNKMMDFMEHKALTRDSKNHLKFGSRNFIRRAYHSDYWCLNQRITFYTLPWFWRYQKFYRRFHCLETSQLLSWWNYHFFDRRQNFAKTIGLYYSSWIYYIYSV